MSQRFPIRIDRLWRPLFGPIGARGDRCYVEVDDEHVRVRMPPLLRVDLPRADVVTAEKRTWPLWRGIGWRHDLRRTVGAIGSRRGVVQLELRESRKWIRFLPRYDRLAVSVDDPDELVAALRPPTEPSESTTNATS